MIVLICSIAVCMNGDIKVEITIIVVIAPSCADVVLRSHLVYAGGSGNLGECTIAIVVEQPVRGLIEQNQQVGIAVVVDIGKARTARTDGRNANRQAGGGSHIRKRAVSIITPQMVITIYIVHEQVFQAIPVIIGNSRADPAGYLVRRRTACFVVYERSLHVYTRCRSGVRERGNENCGRQWISRERKCIGRDYGF